MAGGLQLLSGGAAMKGRRVDVRLITQHFMWLEESRYKRLDTQ